MKFCVFSLGCKVNQYEGLSIIRRIIESGHEATDKIEKSDVYVLNSCAVTMEAEAKSRRLISRFSRLNPEADILLMGCAGQVNAPAFTNPKIKAMTGTANKLKLIEDYINNAVLPDKEKYFLIPDNYEEYIFPHKSRTRTYIKIQDGCDNFCSYCIVPYARGRSRSRGLEDVHREIESTESKEIIFTGINLSDYSYGISSLIASLSRYADKRFRLSSIEPNLINEELLKAWKDSPMCEHFHMSMQSGSDSVLKAMNRHYTSAQFLSYVELIRKYFPDAGITTDLITGFPTETEQNHLETMQTVKSAAFSDMHIFPYSERKGTKAYSMPQIPMNIRRARAAEIMEIAAKMKNSFLQNCITNVYDILIESEGAGYTSNYIKVYIDNLLNPNTIDSADSFEGEFKKATLTRLHRDGVLGETI